MTGKFKHGDKVRARQRDSEYCGDHWDDAIFDSWTSDGRCVVRWDYTRSKEWPYQGGPRPITGIVAEEDIQRR